MKNLKELILEKLVINKNLKSQFQEINREDLPDTNKIYRKTDPYIYAKGNRPSEHQHKMEGYMKKGSKPSTLIHTIKDKVKLFNRWYAAVKLKWREAYIEFGKAVEERGILTLPELHSFILNKYDNCTNQDLKDVFKEYLDTYKIKY